MEGLNRDIPSMTGLRALAAMMVMLGHGCTLLTFTNFHLPSDLIQPLAPLGISVFFSLSGFIMWINYSPAFQTKPLPVAIKAFAVARFARLYPLFGCVFVLGLILAPEQQLRQSFPKAGLIALMLHAWIPSNGTQLLTLSLVDLGHTWSISVEVFLYGTFPLLVFALSARTLQALRWTIFIACISLGLIFYVYQAYIFEVSAYLAPLSIASSNMWITYYSPFTHLFEFVAGCATGALYLKRGTWAPSLALSMASVGGVVASWLLFVSFSHLGEYSRLGTSLYRALAPLSVCGLLLCCTQPMSRLSRTLSVKPLVFMGEVSYSSYLLHPLLFMLFVHPEVPAVSVVGLASLLLIVTGAIITTILFSFGTYTLIEVPARQWIRAVFSGGRRDAPEGGSVGPVRALT